MYMHVYRPGDLTPTVSVPELTHKSLLKTFERVFRNTVDARRRITCHERIVAQSD